MGHAWQIHLKPPVGMKPCLGGIGHEFWECKKIRQLQHNQAGLQCSCCWNRSRMRRCKNVSAPGVHVNTWNWSSPQNDPAPEMRTSDQEPFTNCPSVRQNRSWTSIPLCHLIWGITSIPLCHLIWGIYSIFVYMYTQIYHIYIYMV